MMIFFTVGASSGRHWIDDDRPLKRTYVVEATDYGLQKMNELVNVQEPHLYQIGMTHLVTRVTNQLYCARVAMFLAKRLLT
jgi:hypothetical protein